MRGIERGGAPRSVDAKLGIGSARDVLLVVAVVVDDDDDEDRPRADGGRADIGRVVVLLIDGRVAV